MMRKWRRLSIGLQLGMLLSGSVLVGLVAAYVMGESIYSSQTRNQARIVADMVENVGVWAAKYNGIWVKGDAADPKVGTFLDQEMAAAPVVAQSIEQKGPALAFHRKNPALVQRELSDVTRDSDAHAKYRMTSDRYMNPDNAPDLMDLKAIAWLRENPEANEYYETTGSTLRYARKLIVKPACMSCHDSAERAPGAVKLKFGNSSGFGYKVGGVAGIISVSIPMHYSVSATLKDFGMGAWISMGFFVGVALLIMLYLHSAIIRPVQYLKRFAESAAHSDIENGVKPIKLDADEVTSRNDVHLLSAAVQALYQSVRLLHSLSARRRDNVSQI